MHADHENLATRRFALAALWLVACAAAVRADQRPDCNGNAITLFARGARSAVTPGETVTYMIDVASIDDPSLGLLACDADDIDVLFYCPGADGRPDFSHPNVITRNLSVPADTPPTPLPEQACTIVVNPGVSIATARVRMGDQSGDLDDLSEGRSHTGTQDKPFRRDQLVLTEVVSNTPSTTTSTLPPVCGNGVVEGQEECDPGPTDSECCAVSLGCFVFQPNVGHPCGSQTPAPCRGAGVCAPDGVCRSEFTPAVPATRCRPARTACDLGDFCDGTNAACPTNHQCRADAVSQAGKIAVTCRAPTTTEGNFQCSATAFEPDDASRPDGPVGVCGRRRYTRKGAVQLAPASDPESVEGTLQLALTRAARHALATDGAVRTCVVVRMKFAGDLVQTTRQVVTLRP